MYFIFLKQPMYLFFVKSQHIQRCNRVEQSFHCEPVIPGSTPHAETKLIVSLNQVIDPTLEMKGKTLSNHHKLMVVRLLGHKVCLIHDLVVVKGIQPILPKKKLLVLNHSLLQESPAHSKWFDTCPMDRWFKKGNRTRKITSQVRPLRSGFQNNGFNNFFFFRKSFYFNKFVQ